MVETPNKLQIFTAGQQCIDGRELPGQSDGIPEAGPVSYDIEARDGPEPGVRIDEAGEDPDQRGLARSVGTQQG